MPDTSKPDSQTTSPLTEVTEVSGGVGIDAQRDVTIGGDVVGRDKIIQNIQYIYERALTAAEEAQRAHSIEVQYLAQGIGSLAQRLRTRVEETTSITSGSPYRGLLEYRLNDSEIFFGRDRAIREVLQHAATGSLTILHSESGAGKTSLLQAGVAPRLIGQGHLPLYVRPYDDDPALKIKHEILSDASQAPILTTAPLRAFLRHVTSVLGPHAKLYILIDQFEEFFTRCDEVSRTKFIGELAECLDDASLNVRWLMAIRSEYFGNLANFRPHIRNPFENDYRLNQLTRVEAQLAVQKPIETRGVRFEDGLIDRVLDDLGRPSVLPPQLQLVCATLYEGLGPGAKVITRALYDEEGGAANILRSHLERVLSRDLKPEQRPAAKYLLEALVSSEQQRMIRTRDELIVELSASGVTERTLDVILSQLTDNRLLKVDETADGLAYELAHDYLLGEIKLDPEVQARKAAQELLEQEVRAYRRHKTLLTADRLQVIEPYVDNLQLTREAQQLLENSRMAVQREDKEKAARHQQQLDDARKLIEVETQRVDNERRLTDEKKRINRRLRSFAILLVVALFTMVVAGSVAWTQTNIAASSKLAGQASKFIELSPPLAGLLALESQHIWKNDDAQTILGRLPYVYPPLEATLNDHTKEVTSVAWSPNGHQLVSGSADNTIIVWDATNGQPLRTLKGHTGSVTSVAWSPNGQQLASGSDDYTIIVWDATSGQPLKTLKNQAGRVTSVAWSPNGQQLASGLWDKTIIVWEATSGQPLKTLKGHADRVTSVAWSPDGRELASGSDDHTIIVWDVASGQPVRTLEGHTDSVTSVVWSPNSKQLASSSNDGAIIIWDETSGHVLNKVDVFVENIAWSPNGKQIASGIMNGGVIVWDATSGQPLKTLKGHTGSVASVAWSPDGQQLASGSDDHTINIWNVISDQPLKTLKGHTGPINSVTWNPNGQQLASGSFDNTVIVWDATSGQPLKTLKGHIWPVTSVAWSPDGKQVASGSWDKTIIVWDATSGQPLKTLKGHTDSVTSVAWSPNSKQLASGSNDHTIIVWDVDSGQPLRTLKGHTEFVASVAWSPDGQRLASGSWDKTIIVWDIASGQSLKTLKGHTDTVTSVAWAPNSQQLSSGSYDNTIIVWDATGGQPLRTLRGHTGHVNSVAWSPDGQQLASGSDDNTIIVWDASSGQQKVLLRGYTPMVSSVAWSPDDRYLASGSINELVLLLATKHIRPLCELLTRNLTHDEWLTYMPSYMPYQKTCVNLP